MDGVRHKQLAPIAITGQALDGRDLAETKKDALAAFDDFVETWGVKYDRAAECLIKDREALRAFHDFPADGSADAVEADCMPEDVVAWSPGEDIQSRR